ncbi:hypothetical protein POVCU1_048070 [Plasmodium ovale curtisi]|nr:hypothetical protein POVCU1_048070 [Plasmodium ovale curtisi]
MLFSVAFFQLVMFTFFSRVENKFISVGRNILFLSSSLTTLLLLCRSTEWVSTNHIKKKKGKRTFCYLCEKNVYVSNLKDLNKLKYAYANPYETKRLVASYCIIPEKPTHICDYPFGVSSLANRPNDYMTK